MMMAQITDSTGHPMLVLSLTDEDVTAVQEGRPLYCHTEALPLVPDVDIAVTWGASGEDAAAAIATALPAGHHIRRLAAPVYSPPEAGQQ
jgi:hypothetical protein